MNLNEQLEMQDEIFKLLPCLNYKQARAVIVLYALALGQSLKRLNDDLAKAGLAPVSPNGELNRDLERLGFPIISAPNPNQQLEFNF